MRGQKLGQIPHDEIGIPGIFSGGAVKVGWVVAAAGVCGRGEGGQQ